MSFFLQIFLAVVNDLEEGARNEGDGDSSNVLELDDDALAALDTLDDPGDTLEVAIRDSHLMSLFAEEGSLLRKDDPFVLDGGHADEVAHLVVRDYHDGAPLTVVWAGNHVAQGQELAARHLQVGQNLTGGVDKDEVIDGGDELTPHLAVLVRDHAIAHGDEILDVEVVQVLFDGQFTTIGDSHGIPRQKEGVTTSCDVMSVNGRVCWVTHHREP